MDSLMQVADQMFPNKAFLSIEEVAKFLSCSEKIIYNWNKRPDPRRRPPRLSVGKSIRFPKKDLMQWLSKELQEGCGE